MFVVGVGRRVTKNLLIIKKYLVAIRDCKPKEICYDEWAYKRMLRSYRNCAKEALRLCEKEIKSAT